MTHEVIILAQIEHLAQRPWLILLVLAWSAALLALAHGMARLALHGLLHAAAALAAGAACEVPDRQVPALPAPRTAAVRSRALRLVRVRRRQWPERLSESEECLLLAPRLRGRLGPPPRRQPSRLRARVRARVRAPGSRCGGHRMTPGKPILFSAPMVRALVAGEKTQTRRLPKGQVPAQPAVNCHPRHERKHAAPYLDAYCSERRTAANPRGMSRHWCWWQVDDRQCPPAFDARYVPGDLLWVREAWRTEARYDARPPRDVPSMAIVSYEADYGHEPNNGCRGRYRHARFMPHWASRLALEVTAVRVQRLHDISEDDAVAEGVDAVSLADLPRPAAWSRRHDFAQLWERINGAGAWGANPYVVALTFTVHRCNIDALAAHRAAA